MLLRRLPLPRLMLVPLPMLTPPLRITAAAHAMLFTPLFRCHTIYTAFFFLPLFRCHADNTLMPLPDIDAAAPPLLFC